MLVMDYASGGELYDFINERKGLYEDQARKFFRQIVSAVYYLHMVSYTFSTTTKVIINSQPIALAFKYFLPHFVKKMAAIADF